MEAVNGAWRKERVGISNEKSHEWWIPNSEFRENDRRHSTREMEESSSAVLANWPSSSRAWAFFLRRFDVRVVRCSILFSFRGPSLASSRTSSSLHFLWLTHTSLLSTEATSSLPALVTQPRHEVQDSAPTLSATLDSARGSVIRVHSAGTSDDLTSCEKLTVFCTALPRKILASETFMCRIAVFRPEDHLHQKNRTVYHP
jgi:hypothetical protein